MHHHCEVLKKLVLISNLERMRWMEVFSASTYHVQLLWKTRVFRPWCAQWVQGCWWSAGICFVFDFPYNAHLWEKMISSVSIFSISRNVFSRGGLSLLRGFGSTDRLFLWCHEWTSRLMCCSNWSGSTAFLPSHLWLLKSLYITYAWSSSMSLSSKAHVIWRSFPHRRNSSNWCFTHQYTSNS